MQKANLIVPNIRKSFKLASKELIRWFPGHMGKGLKQMQQKLKQVDLMIGEKILHFAEHFFHDFTF